MRVFFSHAKTKSYGVAIVLCGSKTIQQSNEISDKSLRFLLVEVTINDTVFVLINICSVNTELKLLQTLSDLVSILDKVNDIQNKNIVFGGDFNVILTFNTIHFLQITHLFRFL